MASKQESRKEVEKLIKKYENLSDARKKKINEEDTGKDFILPLFRALGWDVYNDFTNNEVVKEETTISGRIDYSFRINNITQFVIEAKAIPENLEKEKWAKQAIEYGWNKGITWVVLSDFEGTKLFNSDWKVDSPHANLDLSYKDYLTRFDDLWFLSKESFEKGELENQASKWGIKAKRVSVNERLAEDLLRWREELTKNLSQWNEDRNEEIIDESVQRILDRLIFIRVVEDREVEDRILWQQFQRWEAKDNEPQNFIKLLAPIFREFDKKYNSNLFQKHICEDLKTEGDPFRKIIPQLYGEKEEGVKYRFDAINADVLGNVYEQYLGYVQGREGTKSKRKKQGIYYTPTYIVDYIVRNTLGKVLEEKSLTEIENIKVLDPACGSGSFLIKTFDILNEKIKKERGDKDGIQAALRKYRILTANIYGVDLDPQAVEITRLNLLLKALEPNKKLPMLGENIKNGNSLIEDKKVTDKPFVWNEEFSSVMDKGGFDVVVGNPPWVFTRGEHFSNSEKEYFDKFLTGNRVISVKKGKNVQSGKLNLYSLFIVKSISLLKNGGVLGFIVPNNILRTTTYDVVRKYILDNCKVRIIVDLGTGIFKGVTASSIVLVVQKEASEKLRNTNKVNIFLDSKGLFGQKVDHYITQNTFYSNPSHTFNIFSNNNAANLSSKLEKSSVKLGSICEYIIEGIVGSKKKDFSNKKENKLFKPVLTGKEIGSYQVGYKGKWIRYDRDKLHRARPEEVFLSKKIMIRRISGGDHPLVAASDRGKYYTYASVNNLVLKNDVKYKLEYILALLNSSLLNWYYSTNFSNRSELTVNISKTFLEHLPIKDPTRVEQKEIVNLVNNLQEIKKKIYENKNKTDQWNNDISEAKRLIKKINQAVYKLYGLTPEEIEIVEKS